MSEFDSKNVREYVEQDVSDREIAKKAGELINKGREILFSWPEFQHAVSQEFLHRERDTSNSVKFQKADVWFFVSAGVTNLDVTWAENEDSLKEEGWKDGGGRAERVLSRTIGIIYDERPFRSNRPHGNLFYEGPEIKVPTSTFTVPANTRAVIEQIEKGFAEMERL